jgi:hypothetical protein
VPTGRVLADPLLRKAALFSERPAPRLAAKCIVLWNESLPDFEETFHHYIDRFQPVDEIDFTSVEEMAVNYWRLRRAWSIEPECLTSASEP